MKRLIYFVAGVAFASMLAAIAQVTTVPEVTGTSQRLQRVEFTSSDTWVVPGGVYTLYVSGVGGGGGGGGGDDNATTGGGGGGGGSGAAICRVPYRVNPGDSLTVTIATGGTGGAGGASASAGTNGGYTRLAGSSAIQSDLKMTHGRGGSAGSDTDGGNGGSVGVPGSSHLFSEGGSGHAGASAFADDGPEHFVGGPHCFTTAGGKGGDDAALPALQFSGWTDDSASGVNNGGGSGGVSVFANGIDGGVEHMGAADTASNGDDAPANCYGCGGGGGFGAGGGTNGGDGMSGLIILEW